MMIFIYNIYYIINLNHNQFTLIFKIYFRARATFESACYFRVRVTFERCALLLGCVLLSNARYFWGKVFILRFFKFGHFPKVARAYYIRWKTVEMEISRHSWRAAQRIKEYAIGLSPEEQALFENARLSNKQNLAEFLYEKSNRNGFISVID